jgi:hypothetical protein
MGLKMTNTRPSIRPSLLLDFANVKQLDPRVTFARASTAPYYDGKTVAKAEENLFIRSEEFDDVSWQKLNATATANNQIAPNGTTTAETITLTTTAGQHRILRGVPVPTENGANYVVSVFAKAGTHNFIQLAINNQAPDFANFDLSSGTIESTGGSGTSSAVISNQVDGWYRISMSYTAGGTNRDPTIVFVSSGTAVRVESWTPVGTETLFLWGAQLEQRSTVTAYTATTTQPITNYIPVLLTATTNEPRFDHNPLTGESLGLLIEEQRTNLLLRSEEFDNASWNKASTTVTANAIVAPDGTLTADKLVENTASGVQHRIEQAISTTTNQSYAFSIYIKGAELNTFVLQIVAAGSSSTTSTIGFDITDGVISWNGGLSGVVSTVNVLNVGNEWYRCSLVYELNGTVTNHQVRVYPRNSTPYTGDGTSGLFLWGAQLEAGASPTSYIPTEAAQVTRAADNPSITGSNFSSWYRQDEGTFYVEFATPSTSQLGQRIYAIDDGTQTNVIRQSAITFQVVSSATVQANLNSGALYQDDVYIKQAGAYKVNDFATSANGAAVIIDTAGTVPVVDRLFLGAGSGVGVKSFVYKKLAFYPKRLTNTELQAITT